MPSPEGNRREFLASAGSTAAAVALSGCLSEFRANVTHESPDQIDLTIVALPADEDPASIQIARDLQGKLEAVGVDATLNVLTERLLLRDVLFNHDFDVFVARHPGHAEPDDLRPMLHSLYGEEAGWQNPFGLSSRSMDQLVEDQFTQHGSVREGMIHEIQEELLVEQPFTPVASPEYVTAAQSEFVDDVRGFADPLALLRMQRERETLRIALLETHATRNRNPMAVEFRTRDRLTDLLYDPLIRSIGDEYVPWLAEEWTLEADAASVRLREDLTWHDGDPLTASDVAFTYRFLSDTSLGETEDAVPSPRYRSPTSLVESIDAPDDRTVEFEFDGCSDEVCPHALTAPVLPRSQWEGLADLVQEHLTEALLDGVDDPIGSGPLQFVEATTDESVTFERHDDHFLRRPYVDADLEETDREEDTDTEEAADDRRDEDDNDEPTDPLAPFRGGPPFERLEATVAANARSAIESLEEDRTDLVSSPLPTDVREMAREADGVELLIEHSPSYYLVGFNARRHPLSNHQFRAAVARLLDRSTIATEVFDDGATPVESPLHATEFVPDRLRWDGTSAAGEFPGTGGELDVEAARDLFREAGFRYEDGALVGRQ